MPVSPEFAELVNNRIDPVVRSGTGFGEAPIGHRVTVQTPYPLYVDIKIPIAPLQGIEIRHLAEPFQEIMKRYLVSLRRSVINEWERTYYNNIGIHNFVLSTGMDIAALNNFMTANASLFQGGELAVQQAYTRMMALLEMSHPNRHD